MLIIFVGSHLGHSLLPYVYAYIGDILHLQLDVELKQMDSDAFTKFIEEDGLKFSGCAFCCVTFPHKTLAAKLVHHQTPRAKLLGSVNIIYQDPDGYLVGDNTDGLGFNRDITNRLKLQLTDKNILILGSGGVTRGIIPELLKSNPDSIMICKRQESQLGWPLSDNTKLELCTYNSIPQKNYALIINATSASIYNELPPFAADNSMTTAFFYECAYAHHKKTPFEDYLISQNIYRYSNGVGMLIEQAIEAVRYVLGDEDIETEAILRKLEGLERAA